MSMKVSHETTMALNKAKVNLMANKNSTFVCTILFSLRQHWTTDVPTAGVDGINLFINPDWFMAMRPAQRVGLLFHESFHPALDHINRGAELEKLWDDYCDQTYNIAGDYVINNLADHAGLELPDHGYIDHQYDDMTTEEIYKVIKQENHPMPQNYHGDIIPNKGTPEQREAIKRQMDNILVKAKLQAEMANDDLAGSVPADILRRIDELTNPKLPWKVLLANEVDTYAKIEYSYSRPKRRYYPDFYLASMGGQTIEHILFAIDSSGSVDDPEFAAFLVEIQNIIDFCNPQRVTIIDFDTSIKAVHEVNPMDRVSEIEFRGYGGTNIYPAFEKALELNPSLFIMFSDLHCREYTEPTPFPTIWVVVNNPDATVQFGKKLDLIL